MTYYGWSEVVTISVPITLFIIMCQTTANAAQLRGALKNFVDRSDHISLFDEITDYSIQSHTRIFLAINSGKSTNSASMTPESIESTGPICSTSFRSVSEISMNISSPTCV